MLGALINRVAGRFLTKADGDAKPGPWWLPVTGGILPTEVGSFWNWWQLGGMPIPASTRSAIVEACVSAYAQTTAMCPGYHYRATGKGGRERVTNSALSRVLQHPNDYESSSDFMLNMVRSMYLEGNGYALGIRNNRYEIDQLHIMNPAQSQPQLATTGDVFYRLGGNQVIDYRIGNEPLIVPSRDVLHFKLHVSRARWPFPLVGETPLMAAIGDVSVMNSIMQQQLGFYANQAKPAAVLSTDLVLDKDQVQALRDRWAEQTRGIYAGGTPILTAGLKVQPWAVGGKDAAIADVMKFSDEHVALAFRVPQQILGIGASAHGSTEVLMSQWIASGLGFCLNHIEETYNRIFGLRGYPDEWVEFDTQALLRSAMNVRIEALARGVQGGIYSPNEARNTEGLDNVKFGDEPRVQQQVVPLSAAAAIPAAPGSPGPGGAPPAAGPHASEPKKPTVSANDNNGAQTDDRQREIRNILRSAQRAAGRRTSGRMA